MTKARSVVLQALLHVNQQQGYSNIVFDQTLRKANLDRRDAAFASVLFYGVLERKLTLDAVISKYSKTKLQQLTPVVSESLRMGVYQILFMDKVPPSAAVDQSVELVKNSKERKAAGYVNGVLRSLLRSKDQIVLSAGTTIRDQALFYSVPVWMVEHFTHSYGQETMQRFFEHSFGRPPLYVRCNGLRTTEQDLVQQFLKEGIGATPVLSVPGALCIESGADLHTLPSYQQGKFHVQDLSSQLCCKALDVRAGQRVLDVCSAPGGKAFTLAQMMNNVGELHAFDLYEKRVGLIRQGAERLGLSCIQADVQDAQESRKACGLFDRILCDVPCSGLGILRRKPEIRYKNDVKLDNLPDLQYRILCQSARYLRVGGRMVYSTCTLNPKENGDVVARFLQEHSAFRAVDVFENIERVYQEPLSCLTLFPHMLNSDGFFLACLEKVR